MGRKLGAVPLFWGGKLSHHLTQSPGPRPTSILSGILSHQAVWPQRTWAENWRAVPLFMGADWSPFNIMWRGPRPTCTSSFILIHSIVWLQYTNITDRTAQTGQRSDSKGRTVFGRPFVKRFALCYQTVVCLSVCLSCLSCLSVTLVYCGQTVGRIKMKLGMQVDLCLGHIVLDG